MIGLWDDSYVIDTVKGYINDAHRDSDTLTRIVNQYDYIPEGQSVIDVTLTLNRIAFMLDVLLSEVIRRGE